MPLVAQLGLGAAGVGTADELAFARAVFAYLVVAARTAVHAAQVRAAFEARAVRSTALPLVAQLTVGAAGIGTADELASTGIILAELVQLALAAGAFAAVVAALLAETRRNTQALAFNAQVLEFLALTARTAAAVIAALLVLAVRKAHVGLARNVPGLGKFNVFVRRIPGLRQVNVFNIGSGVLPGVQVGEVRRLGRHVRRHLDFYRDVLRIGVAHLRNLSDANLGTPPDVTLDFHRTVGRVNLGSCDLARGGASGQASYAQTCQEKKNTQHDNPPFVLKQLDETTGNSLRFVRDNLPQVSVLSHTISVASGIGNSESV